MKEIKSKVMWGAIKKQYETTDRSVRDIAREYDISYNTINNRIKKENWEKRRELTVQDDMVILEHVRNTLDVIDIDEETRVTTKEAIDKVFVIIDKIKEIQLNSLNIINNKLLKKLDNAIDSSNIEELEICSNIINKLGLSIDKTISAYKEPADVYIMNSINGIKSNETIKPPVINIIAS
jgi:mevalonate kinase